MRTFVTLLVATLFLTVLASGLMAFLLPFDIVVTRIHALSAPLFGAIVLLHLFNNRKIFSKHLGKGRRLPQALVLVCIGLIGVVVGANLFPASLWMNLGYENRQRDKIFRPSEQVVSKEIRGLMEIRRESEVSTLRLVATARDGAPETWNAVWLESEEGELLETLHLSQGLMFREEVKVAGQATTRAELLPVWWHRWQKSREPEENELDAISAPTPRTGYDFESYLSEISPRFQLMMESTDGREPSQVYSVLVDVNRLKLHYLMDFLATGSSQGALAYDSLPEDPGNLLFHKILLTLTHSTNVSSS